MVYCRSTLKIYIPCGFERTNTLSIQNRKETCTKIGGDSITTQYAIIVITPDSVRDSLADRIIIDLTVAIPMEILWQKCWRIESEDVVLSIYPKLSSRLFYPLIVRTMMLGECLVLLVRGDGIIAKLKAAKGKLDYTKDRVGITGLRAKYKNWSVSEIEGIGLESMQAMKKIFEFRLHTTDDLTEAANICALCMGPEDIQNLLAIDLELYKETTRILAS